jgi:hypothetical protein
MTKKGAQWRRVQATSLSEKSRKLYRQYAQKVQEASAIGHKLKDAVTSEWNDKYPDGINGQVCAFNAMNGVLQYVMKNKKRPKTSAKKAFDEASGDDVFASPPTGPEGQAGEEDKVDTSGTGVAEKLVPKWKQAIEKKKRGLETSKGVGWSDETIEGGIRRRRLGWKLRQTEPM